MSQAQDLFLQSLEIKKATLKDLWWRFRDAEGELQYWEYESDLRFQSFAIMFESFILKYKNDKTLSGFVSSLMVDPIQIVLAFHRAIYGGQKYKEADLRTYAERSLIGNYITGAAHFLYQYAYYISNQGQLTEVGNFVARNSSSYNRPKRGTDEAEYKAWAKQRDDTFLSLIVQGMERMDAEKKLTGQSLGISLAGGRAQGIQSYIPNYTYESWNQPGLIAEIISKAREKYNMVWDITFDLMFASTLKKEWADYVALEKKAYDEYEISFKEFLDTNSKNPELQSLVPSLEAALTQIKTKVIPPPQTIQAVELPPPAPIETVSLTPVAEYEGEPVKKKSILPWAAAGAGLLYYLLG